MYQGFYNLTSGMLTQGRNLNVISNNMVNVQSAGYKSEKMLSSTFQEEMLYRSGKHRSGTPEALSSTSKIRTATEIHVNYDPGSMDITDGIFDFALGGRGFFCIDTPNGERYTRNGAFTVDDDGYLVLNKAGRVLSADNQPIRIDDENFFVDSQGTITAAAVPGEGEEDTGDAQARVLGKLKVVDFGDYDQLVKEDYGVFSSTQEAQPLVNGDEQVNWKMLEKSNVDMVEEMTAMITSQRALQSAAQMLKMYDQIMGRAVTIGTI